MRGCASIVVVLAAACSFEGGGASLDGLGPIDLALDAAPDAGGGCFATFCYRKAITVAPARVFGGQSLAEFTLLVDLPADAELALHARPDGHDLKFVADGTDLAYERVAWNAATGRLLAWVRVPVLSATTTTTIYLQYGNPGFATDAQRPADAWAPSYQGVWHLDQTVSSGLQDSTIHANDATEVAGAVAGANGLVGQAVAFDGIDDRLAVADSASLDAVAGAGTISLWINYVDARAERYQVIVSTTNRYLGDDGLEWATQSAALGSGHYFYPWGASGNYNLGQHAFGNGTWHHAAVVFDRLGTAGGPAPRYTQIFIDGLPVAYTTLNVPTLWTQSASLAGWLWGANPDAAATNHAFGGVMDELRVSTAVRTQGFLQTEASNQRAPTTFSQLGPQELTP